LTEQSLDLAGVLMVRRSAYVSFNVAVGMTAPQEFSAMPSILIKFLSRAHVSVGLSRAHSTRRAHQKRAVCNAALARGFGRRYIFDFEVMLTHPNMTVLCHWCMSSSISIPYRACT